MPWLLESVVRIRPLKSPFQNHPRNNHVIDEEMTGNMEQAGCESSFANALVAVIWFLLLRSFNFSAMKLDYDHTKSSCKGLM
jgi:hypothetical protein